MAKLTCKMNMCLVYGEAHHLGAAADWLLSNNSSKLYGFLLKWFLIS